MRSLLSTPLLLVLWATSAVAQQGTYGDQSPAISSGRDSIICHNCTIAPGGSERGGTPAARGSLRWSSNQWVDGDGDLEVFTGSKSECSQACLESPTCRFVEYHRPTRKCNLFSYAPPVKSGKDADVAYRN